MKLLALRRDEPNEEGRRDEIERALREARLDVARRCRVWQEISDDFVPRGYRGMSLVSASTDHVYEVVRGVVFQSGSASVVADQTPLWFTVNDDGELRFYTRETRTWSEQVAARERRRNAPKPQRTQ